MKNIFRFYALTLIVLLLPACSKPAATTANGGLEISQAWARPMPPGSTVGAGYAHLRNAGSRPLSISSLSSPVAQRVEIHSMSLQDGQMQMREVKVALAPGESLDLAPGGSHLMFFGVPAPFAPGQRVALTLQLDDGQEQRVELLVGESGADAGDHQGHH